MGWFLYDNGTRHEMGKHVSAPSKMFDRVLNKASEVICCSAIFIANFEKICLY